MSDFETKNPAGDNPDNWQAQCAALQKQISTGLLALFIVSGTLSVFLWRQSRMAGAELDAARRSFGPMLQKFTTEQKPAWDAFELKLAEFGRTHPDFTRLLNNYNVQLPAAPAAAPKAATPAAPQKK